MDWNGLGLDWARPAQPGGAEHRHGLQPRAPCEATQRGRDRQGRMGSAEQGQGRRQQPGAAQPPAPPAAALLSPGRKGPSPRVRRRKTTRIDLPAAPRSSATARVSMETKLVE